MRLNLCGANSFCWVEDCLNVFWLKRLLMTKFASENCSQTYLKRAYKYFTHPDQTINKSLDWKRSSGWLESWEGLLLVTNVSTTCAEAIFRVKWLPHRLSKRQSLTTVLLRTPITQMIFFNQGILLLGSNHFLSRQRQWICVRPRPVISDSGLRTEFHR